MSILIVSDIHLGAPGRLLGSDEKLVTLILSQDWDRIVLLGDVFDLWAMSIREIMKEHSAVFAALQDAACPIVFVPGNHDDALKGINQLDSWAVSWPIYEFTSGGVTFTAVHGDAYDKLEGIPSRIGAWFGRLFDRLAAWIIGPGVSVTRFARATFARIAGREFYARPLHERAIADLGCENLIIGHSHAPVAHDEIDGSVVVGSGDFGPEHMTYVVVDGGKAELRTAD